MPTVSYLFTCESKLLKDRCCPVTTLVIGNDDRLNVE